MTRELAAQPRAWLISCLLSTCLLGACSGEPDIKDKPPTEESADKKKPDDPFEACEGNDAESCYALGNLFEVGAGVEQRPAAAVEYYARACRLKHMEACARVGQFYYRGEVIKQNLEMARKVSQVACKADVPSACHLLAQMYQEGKGVAADPARARELSARACTLHWPVACYETALRLRDGQPRKIDQARQHFEQACSSGSAKACMRIAWLQLDPCLADVKAPCHFGRTDHKEVSDAMRARCAKDDAISCAAAGLYLEKGKVGLPDYGGAFKLYQQACSLKGQQLGAGWGCHLLGDLLRSGRSGQLAPSRAIGQYGMACKLGFLDACRELGAFYINQRDDEQLVSRGVELLQKACKGNREVCRELGTLCTLGIKEACAPK